MSPEQRALTQPGPARTFAGRKRPRGQVLVIFASAITLLLLMVAIVIDVSWLWSNALRVQRAADAAALAGAVTLPNDPGKGVGLALAEAKKNGYVPGGTTVVAPNQDPQNLHRMHVLITAPVQTFFMRLVGFPTVMVSRQSDADYNLPVPMGSPQNYYGVGLYNVPTFTTNTSQPIPGSTGFEDTNNTITRNGNNQNLPDSQTWDGPPSRAENDDGNDALESTSGDTQTWDEFGLQGGSNIPTPGSSTNGNVTTTTQIQITQVQVRLRDIHLTPTNTQNARTNCSVEVQVHWGGGAVPSQAQWLNPIIVPLTSTTDQTIVVPSSAADIAAFAAIPWTYSDFDDQVFEVHLRWVEGTGCGSTGNNGVDRAVALDNLQAQVNYTRTTTTVTKNPPSPQPVKAPDGTVLAPQLFWGAMNSYGSPSIQGDAFMTGYATRKSAANPAHDPDNYYNYEVDIPNGASLGEVWIFDPGFCDVDSGEGTGEYWTVGGSNGASSKHPVSALYELWNTKDTLYDRSDDTMVATSGNTFTRSYLYDPNLDGDNSNGYTGSPASCANASWHKTPGGTQSGWWQLAGGLGAGTYRVHTTSEPQSGGDDQSDSTGLNAFALWTKASGGTPRVHGLGSMEAYFPLPADQTSTFYLAQIDKEYAGKWMDIDLWDPGDTGQLPADLSILMPTTGGYQKATFYYKSIQGTTIPSTFVCDQNSSNATQTITTSNGNGGLYNGYWLRLCIKIDNLYKAPKPTGEAEGGWWKIQYSMGGNSNDNPSTDLTTWSVNIRGNPVHLVTG